MPAPHARSLWREKWVVISVENQLIFVVQLT